MGRYLRSVLRLSFVPLLLGIVLSLSGCAGGRGSVPGGASNSSSEATSGDVAPVGLRWPRTDQLMHEGADAYAHGDFSVAVSRFEQAAAQYSRARREAQRADALFDLAAAYEALGSYQEAADSLMAALSLARRLSDAQREIDALAALGSVFTFTRNYPAADQVIDQGLKLAARAHDDQAVAKLLSGRGSLLAAQGNYAAAYAAFREASQQSPAVNPLTRARETTNAALVMLRAEKYPKAIDDSHEARASTLQLHDCHDKASLLITQGRIIWLAHKDGVTTSPATSASTAPGTGAGDESAVADSVESYVRAAQVAETIGDRLMLSFALGYQGEIAEADHRYAQALALTRRASFSAQEARSSDVLYRWQWQIARLLRDQGQISDAIDTYDNALTTLHDIRGDLSNGFGNLSDPGSFRDSVGPIYYEMADLLLRRADSERNEDKVQDLLLKARETVEALKSGELEDYFQRKCVNLLDQKRIEQIDAGTAVVYLIPLPDRTEMLVSTTTGLKRFRSPIGSEKLTEEVREFRDRLEDRTSNRFLRNARNLYNWIIRPIEPTLRAEKIDTLVFVPDGALRTVPMAALNDGKEFLIARYAIAITPGLTLMAPRRIRDITRPTMLEGGLSQSVGGFPPLEFVPQELSGIHQLFPGTQLLNSAFTAQNLSAQMGAHEFTFVHLASHAEFSHNEKETFLLVYPNSSDPSAKKLSLKQLGDLLRQTKFRDQPVELLALSACQTAAGDDRAALGLAGIAIEMGARSAVATLWSINDQASADLVEHFYTAISTDPTLSKAKAMQRAQLELMKDVRYRHPCYWAPYLVIGNWL